MGKIIDYLHLDESTAMNTVIVYRRQPTKLSMQQSRDLLGDVRSMRVSALAFGVTNNAPKQLTVTVEYEGA